MSRFIKLKNLTIIIAFLFIIISLINGNIYLFALSLFLEVMLCFNRLINKKMYTEIKKFSPQSNIRNIDYLIIGDICNTNNLIPKGKTIIKIMAPNRSIMSSYEILKHTFSILNEENATVIIINKNNLKKQYTIFDIPYFPMVTINRLMLHKMKKMSEFPLFFAPIKSIKFFINKSNNQIKDVKCPVKEIINFCEDRNIKLIYKEII